MSKTPKIDATFLLRFWRKVDKEGPVPEHARDLGPCWVWLGKKNDSGYGLLTRKGFRAHRVSWQIEHGEAPAQDVLHKCDNRACVRPSHLFQGDQPENMRDMWRKGRGKTPPPQRDALNYQSKLSAAQVAELRAAYASGEKQDHLAERYGIHQSTVSRLILGQSRRDVPTPPKRRVTRRYVDRDGEKNKMSKLTQEAAMQIRKSADDGASHAALATAFGVSPSTVWMIARRKSWSAVLDANTVECR